MTERASSIPGYSIKDAAALLDVAPAAVRSLIAAGFLAPPRGDRGEFRLSFQDLILLRTAKGLKEANVPARRLRSALRKLRQQLRETAALSAVRIVADGARVLAKQGGETWEPESGQTIFDFAVSDLAGRAGSLARRAAVAARLNKDAETSAVWFAIGYELEISDPKEAEEAYRKAIELDPKNADALVNLGRLRHEAGDVRAAEALYRRALHVRPKDATAAFDLGVALEDQGRTEDAAEAYETALRMDAEHADAHFNLAGVLERLGKREHALQHLKACRKLMRG